MLEYLIAVQQYSVALAVLLPVLGITISRTGGRAATRRFIGALAVGAGLAAVLAVLKAFTGWIVTEYWNLGFLAAILVCGLAYVVCELRLGLRRTARGLPTLYAHAETEPLSEQVLEEHTESRDTTKSREKLERLRLWLICLVGGLLVVYVLRGDLLYIREFVQGDEELLSVIVLHRLLGWLAGLAVLGLCAAGVAVVTRRLSVPQLRVLCLTMLTVYLLTALLSCVQIFYTHNWIPRAPWLRTILQFYNNYGDLFLYLLLALAIVATVLALRNARKGRRSGEPNPALRRKARAAWRTLRRWSTVVAGCCLIVVLSLTVVRALNEQEVELTPAEPLEYAGAEAVIPLDLVSDGHLHRFIHMSEGNVEVRFIVIKKSEAAYGVGLDACNICGATGYYERDDEVVCKMCDVVMNKQTIGFPGGCNPIPLEFSIDEGTLSIAVETLEAGATYFD
ncbi:MAG: Fe-S-containing protein [Coriobacteriales bacterium]|jgi:uncharacterized membrane protein|nr:Fe-S-containing protein [Coriobacteriales bacterium]